VQGSISQYTYELSPISLGGTRVRRTKRIEFERT